MTLNNILATLTLVLLFVLVYRALSSVIGV